MQIKVARPPPTLFVKGIELPPVLSETKKKKKRKEERKAICAFLSLSVPRTCGNLGKKKGMEPAQNFFKSPAELSPFRLPPIGIFWSRKVAKMGEEWGGALKTHPREGKKTQFSGGSRVQKRKTISSDFFCFRARTENPLIF